MSETSPNAAVATPRADSESHRKSLLNRLMAEDAQVSAAAPDATVSAAKSTPGLTHAQVLATLMEGYADRPFLGQRATQLSRDPANGRVVRVTTDQFEVLTYGEIWRRARALASFWRGVEGAVLSADDMLVSLGFASIDYVTLLLAGFHNGAVFVPIQAGGARAQLQAMLDETKPAWLAVSCEHLDAAVALILGGHRPKGLLLFDYCGEADDDRERLAAAREQLSAAGVADLIISIDEAVSRGERMEPAPLFAEPDSDRRLRTIYYTSGSTGLPKGAMLPEEVIKAPLLSLTKFPVINVHYMPMNHSFGPTQLCLVISSGGTTYLTKSDLSNFLDDIRLVRPTTMTFIPRVCEMIYSQFQVEFSRRSALDADPATLRERMLREWREDRLGGRVVRAHFASAPLTPALKSFMADLVGVPLDEAFGSTESAGILFNSKITRPPVIDYRLADVPELGYYTTDKPHPRGELLVKSKGMMLGYYNQPDLTAKMFDEDGYYRTGDIMEEVEPDHLIFVDRRNNVLKLAQSEFVAVQRLEGLFSSGSPLIAQAFIYGTSTRSFLLAALVPDAAMVSEMGLDGDDEGLRAALRAAIQDIAEKNELQSYETPRDFIIEHQPFTIENGLLTSSAKLARPKLTATYAPRLEALYEQIAERQAIELDLLRSESGTATVLETVIRAVKVTLGLEEIDPDRDGGFTELGGDSLAALSFSLLLSELFDVEVPVGVIANPASTLRELAWHIGRLRASSHAQPTFTSVHGAGVTEVRAADLTLEKFLGEDIAARAAAAAPPAKDIRTVLVTGATGFLGRFLCLEWLERMAAVDGKVVAIVRGRDKANAFSRLAEAYNSGDPELERRFTELAEKHLEVLGGDLSEYLMGLSREDWDRCAASVDLIVHPGAFVNHVLPYSQLFGPNVVGTAELIRLATSVRMKPFSNVSTMAVAFLPGGASILDEEADVRTAYPVLDASAESYAAGYGISKWAAEVLLRNAHDKLGLPVSIYRCDMILAHSRYVGQLNIPDLFTRLLLSIALTGLAPVSFYKRSNQRPHYDGLPVDFIAHAMVELDLASTGAIKTYHVVNPHDDGISLDSFVDWMVEAGLPITRIPDYQEWLARFTSALKSLPEQKRQQTSLPLMHQLSEPARGHSGAIVSATAFRDAVRAQRIGGDGDIPHLGASFIAKYVDDLRATGLLDR